jgi:cobalt/nickel transport system permease protein
VTVNYLCKPFVLKSGWPATLAAFCSGAGAIILSALLMAASLLFTDEKFMAVAGATVAVHLPVMVIEGLVTAFCIGFLKKVQPELFQALTPENHGDLRIENEG